jgi:5-methyltetrahydrofolate--homocysteine methyltransferase
MNFRELLKSNRLVFLDGGMGTMLQANGLKVGAIPEELNVTNPQLIERIHREYIQSGANVIYANTFSANGYKLSKSEYSVQEIVSKGIEIAKSATKGTDTLVALDIGPIGKLIEPTGTMTFEESYEIYKEMITAGSQADLIVFETMTDLYELKSAVLCAKENSDLPIMCTMTFEENGRTFTGCSISAMALTLEGLGVDAIGVNCSLGPKELLPIIEELSKWTNLPMVIKANAGLPNPVTNEYDITPEDFTTYMVQHADLGVKVLGGCCGTNPEYINTMVNALKDREYHREIVQVPCAVCSYSETVEINQPRVIGERINPTGKKLFKQALIDHNIDYILNQALEQTSAGADILDVNVGLPDIDEKAMMVETVKALQSITDVPLQLDSTIPEVLESALRVYNGKPIVNSVNGEEDSLNNILPLVKKYGACVVGLTLDSGGITKTAEGRFNIAKKIMDRAVAMGIPKENVFIDCLTLTASAEQKGVLETLKALYRVKHELGLRTVLGVSNISFGLPNRELINCNFLTMALTNGLDLPIMNPNIASMMGAVRAYKVLNNIDENSTDYITAYANVVTKTTITTKSEGGNDTSKTSSGNDIFHAIENGLKNEARKCTEVLLETKEPMEIINDMLIPALDKVGAEFEKGKIFLPQLILSAGASQSAFDVIKEYMVKNNSAPVSKGKIVLATVHGDIHDIGKNIVKVLLENYGYDVIDLGKDVPEETVLNAVKEHNVKLCGLSALMTTTLGAMENTIKLIRAENLDCKVVVGGAVLTPEYAEKIGADFYAKDAKETVDVAKKIIG